MSYEIEIFLDSSFLKEARYSENHLTIFFVNGAVIDYEAPREVFDTMCLAESPGKFYHECVKGKYESTKL